MLIKCRIYDANIILVFQCFAEGNNDISNVSRATMLKFIYGDLTPSRINDLKEACKREV